MNIALSYPNFVPLALQPATEAARRDTQQRELIPAARQGDAYAKESQVGSEKDRARNNDSRPVAYQPETASRGATSQQDVAAANDEQQGKQQGQEKGQSGDRSGSGQDQTERQQQAEQVVVDSLKQRDREVRAHEQAHQAVGGQYASAPSFTMQSGPDGGRYATGGKVQIDISAEPDPEATIRKMQQVQAAALAPVDPSGQDRAVAAKAAQMALEARAQLQSQGATTSGSDTADKSGMSTNATESAASGRSRSYVQESLTNLMSQRNRVISSRYELASQPIAESQISRYA
jgi:hypothetical protein